MVQKRLITSHTYYLSETVLTYNKSLSVQKNILLFVNFISYFDIRWFSQFTIECLFAIQEQQQLVSSSELSL